MDPGLRAKGSLAGHELVETERINGNTNIKTSSSIFVFKIHFTHKTLSNNNQVARVFSRRFRVVTLMNVIGRRTGFMFFFFFCLFVFSWSLYLF